MKEREDKKDYIWTDVCIGCSGGLEFSWEVYKNYLTKEFEFKYLSLSSKEDSHSSKFYTVTYIVFTNLVEKR